MTGVWMIRFLHSLFCAQECVVFAYTSKLLESHSAKSLALCLDTTIPAGAARRKVPLRSFQCRRRQSHFVLASFLEAHCIPTSLKHYIALDKILAGEIEKHSFSLYILLYI